jgi:hypothetical protein
MCPGIFVIFICKRDAKTKTCECKYIFIISYAATVWGTWGLKDPKAENIIMISSMQV